MELAGEDVRISKEACMKPAPPEIMMFFTSGRGVNFVVPMSTGASFQMP